MSQIDKERCWFLCISIFLLAGIAFLLFSPLTTPHPELHIPATGCLFRIDTNDTHSFYTDVFVDNKLKILIDNEIYWIEVVKDGE